MTLMKKYKNNEHKKEIVSNIAENTVTSIYTQKHIVNYVAQKQWL